MMIRSSCCITIEARKLPTYDGFSVVDDFLRKLKSVVPEQQWFDALKWALHATPTRWCGTNEGNFMDWHGCRRMMHLQLGKPQLRMKVSQQEWNNLCAQLFLMGTNICCTICTSTPQPRNRKLEQITVAGKAMRTTNFPLGGIQ